jgi:hypothetical protein
MHNSTIYILFPLVPTCSGIIAIFYTNGDNAGTCRNQAVEYMDCRIAHLLVLPEFSYIIMYGMNNVKVIVVYKCRSERFVLMVAGGANYAW